MPPRDIIHPLIKQALTKEGWQITADPYVISYGERFLFIDLAAKLERLNGKAGRLIGAKRGNRQIALEIKEFRSNSAIADQMLLRQVDPERELYLAISGQTYAELFCEPIGELVIRELPLKLVVVDLELVEVKQWIPPEAIAKS
jgi:hypothetical protein